MKKIDIAILLFFILTSLFTLKDLFLPDFYTSHDGPHQIVRAYYYHQLLQEGQFPPRWVAGLNNGFGYPLFIFSYHLPWLLTEIFRLFGLSAITGVKMAFLSGFILSGITMYFFQKHLFSRFPAFVGTVIYLFAPFRFSNIFVRAAIGDATAFIFPPLIFWSFDKLISDKKINYGWLILYAFSLTALLLSHAMVFFFYSVGLSVYGLYRLLLTENKINLIRANLLAFILFISYSAFYLLPSYFERSYTRFSQVMAGTFNNLSFLSLAKLIYSPWGYGTIDARQGAMSLSIGFAQLAVVLMVFLLIVYFILNKNYRQKMFRGKIFIFFFIFLLSVYLMLPVSRPLWQIVSRYLFIDFNWRVLNLTVFTVSVLSGSLIYHFIKLNFKLTPVIALFLISLSFYANRNHLRINQQLDWTVPFFLKLEKTTNSFDEYNPRWVNPQFISENAPPVNFTADFSYQTTENKSRSRKYLVNAFVDGIFTVNTLYYPGWTVYDSGRQIDIDYQNRGLIEFPLSKGSHNLEIIFEKTPLRRFSDLLTFSSIILTVVYLFRKKFHA